MSRIKGIINYEAKERLLKPAMEVWYEPEKELCEVMRKNAPKKELVRPQNMVVLTLPQFKRLKALASKGVAMTNDRAYAKHVGKTSFTYHIDERY